MNVVWYTRVPGAHPHQKAHRVNPPPPPPPPPSGYAGMWICHGFPLLLVWKLFSSQFILNSNFHLFQIHHLTKREKKSHLFEHSKPKANSNEYRYIEDNVLSAFPRSLAPTRPTLTTISPTLENRNLSLREVEVTLKIFNTCNGQWRETGWVSCIR